MEVPPLRGDSRDMSKIRDPILCGKLFTANAHGKSALQHVHWKMFHCRMFTANCSLQRFASKCSRQHIPYQIPDVPMFQNGSEGGGNPCT